MKLAVYFPDQEDPPQTLTIDKDRIRIGRNAQCELVIDEVRFPKVSGLHAELIAKNDQLWLVHHSNSNPTLLGDQPVDKPTLIKVGQRFRLGHTGPTLVILGSDDATSHTVIAGKSSDYLPAEKTEAERIELGDGCVLGREDSATYRLNHPHVSRRHAAIQRKDGVAYIKDLGSANGTFVDGERVAAKRELPIGGVIDIGPYTLVYDGQSLISRSRKDNISLSARAIQYVVDDKTTSQSLSLLSGVSMSVEPGEFVSILGPSGSGKSTLLRVISGRQNPTSGYATINGQNLHKQFQALKADIVVVPQVTQFHDVLSVRKVLGYAASLRLPVDTSRQEREQIVSDSLVRVGLEARAETRVRNLSGGQQKRLALANELVSSPSLVFLDEVTSGLDEKADQEIMRLLRNLADGGKTVVCVTHNLGYVEACCHKVLILTVGGYTAFFGKPHDAKQYFGVGSLSDIYGVLATRTPEQWSQRYTRISSGVAAQDRAIREHERIELNKQPRSATRIGLRPLSQAAVLVKRYIEVWLNDPLALAATFGQAALVGILLCLVFSTIPDGTEPGKQLDRASELRNLLFLVGISCLWLGANNAAKELVKERTIYQREHNFNLLPESYWFSKAFVLSVIGLVQSSALTAGVMLFCDVPGSLASYLGVAALLSVVGTMLGLAISAWSKTEELSVALIPIVIIPQIILAGVVAELDDASRLVAKTLTTSYWGQTALEVILPAADRMQANSETEAAFAICVLALQFAILVIVTLLRLRFNGKHEG